MAGLLQEAYRLEAWSDERCLSDRQFGLLSHRVSCRALQKLYRICPDKVAVPTWPTGLVAKSPLWLAVSS